MPSVGDDEASAVVVDVEHDEPVIKIADVCWSR